MDRKEVATRLAQSLAQNPIAFTGAETWRIGAAFFLRQALLFAPGYAFMVWGSLHERELQGMDQAPLAVAALALIPYYFASLGLAETWRRAGAIERAPQGVWKTGFALWWRALAYAIRFIWVALILGVAAGLAGVDEKTTMGLFFGVWFILLIPIMGWAVRHRLRQRSIENGLEEAPVTGLQCPGCGQPMQTVAGGGGSLTMAASQRQELRCDLCDLTRFVDAPA